MVPTLGTDEARLSSSQTGLLAHTNWWSLPDAQATELALSLSSNQGNFFISLFGYSFLPINPSLSFRDSVTHVVANLHLISLVFPQDVPPRGRAAPESLQCPFWSLLSLCSKSGVQFPMSCFTLKICNVSSNLTENSFLNFPPLN